MKLQTLGYPVMKCAETHRRAALLCERLQTISRFQQDSSVQTSSAFDADQCLTLTRPGFNNARPERDRLIRS